ncbi:MAG: DUF1178 family protein [Casimicrobiaceae bacterium]
MIIFELRCAHGHRFEGWFASGEEFAQQQERGIVTCPVCDDGRIERVPSARVAIARGAAEHRGAARDNAPAAEATEERPAGDGQSAAMGLPVEAIAKLRELVRNTENVGHRFPEEARRIHYAEATPRAIRGQASHDEAKALREEGIEFTSLPAFLTRDSH